MGHHTSIRLGAIAPAPLYRTAAIQEAPPDDGGVLDGSVESLRGFLAELANLVSAGCDTADGPVLLLQFGAIQTMTSVCTGGDMPSLSITALLPRRVPRGPAPAAAPAGCELLWDADEGRYVQIRRIPVTSLRTEPGVLDAILEMADQAAAWFASVDAVQAGSC